MADFDCEFFGLVFQGFRLPPKNSLSKFTPKLVGIPLQFHFLEPIFIFHPDFLLTGEPLCVRQEKGTQTQTSLVWISLGRVGGFRVNGWGPKVRYAFETQGNQTFGGEFLKRSSCSVFGP